MSPTSDVFFQKTSDAGNSSYAFTMHPFFTYKNMYITIHIIYSTYIVYT